MSAFHNKNNKKRNNTCNNNNNKKKTNQTRGTLRPVAKGGTHF